jgi:poly-gamma-glutamate synthesis protein (capsule biosynthesis protein)
LDGDPSTLPRLEAIIVQTPLPPGWRLSEGGEARVAIELQAGRAGAKDGPGELSAPAGKRWLVPALMLADPRFSMSADEARSHGLEPLDEVIPPQRAAAIDGFWPGQTGYPFEEDLRLAVRASKGELPSEISSWALEAAKRADEDAERPIALGATGDIQVGPREGSLLISGEEGKAAVLGQGLLPLLRSFDFLIGNLEGQISLRGEPNPRKRYLFRFPPGTAAALKSAGFGLLLLGNNHALDYGLDALRDTFGDFDGAGLPYVGAGLDAAAAASPKVVRIAGSNRGFAFLGFAAFPKENMGFSTEEAAAAKDRPGVNADEAGTVAAIRSAAAAGEVVVVLCHGGREYLDDPPEDVKERYRRFVDAGAALVIGSHPHVLQGVEARGSSLIAYSLGNFLFTGEREPPAGQRGALVSILMYRGIARGLRLYPLSVTYEGSYLNGDAAAAEGRFARLCAALSAAPQESPAASP